MSFLDWAHRYGQKQYTEHERHIKIKPKHDLRAKDGSWRNVVDLVGAAVGYGENCPHCNAAGGEAGNYRWHHDADRAVIEFSCWNCSDVRYTIREEYLPDSKDWPENGRPSDWQDEETCAMFPPHSQRLRTIQLAEWFTFEQAIRYAITLGARPKAFFDPWTPLSNEAPAPSRPIGWNGSKMPQPGDLFSMVAPRGAGKSTMKLQSMGYGAEATMVAILKAIEMGISEPDFIQFANDALTLLGRNVAPTAKELTHGPVYVLAKDRRRADLVFQAFPSRRRIMVNHGRDLDGVTEGTIVIESSAYQLADMASVIQSLRSARMGKMAVGIWDERHQQPHWG